MRKPPSPPSATTRSTTTIFASIQAAYAHRRPVLHHLNADTSWLLQLPRPSSSSPNAALQSSTTCKRRKWFNILLDPWLTGPQSDLASWFSTQWHAETPAYPSIAAVEALCARGERCDDADADAVPPQRHDGDEEESLIDAVLLSHEFTDHCHKATLLACAPGVPVYAAGAKAARLVRSWGHFVSVREVPAFGADGWQEAGRLDADADSGWVRAARLREEGDALYYHSAVAVVFALEAGARWEGVVYTPHGVRPAALEPLVKGQGDENVRPLALLHGLHDVRLDWRQQLNLGARNGLSAQRLLQARYWVATHDEVKVGRGVVSWFLRRKVWSVKDAVEAELKDGGKEGDGSMEDVRFVEMENGAAVALLAGSDV